MNTFINSNLYYRYGLKTEELNGGNEKETP